MSLTIQEALASTVGYLRSTYKEVESLISTQPYGQAFILANEAKFLLEKACIELALTPEVLASKVSIKSDTTINWILLKADEQKCNASKVATEIFNLAIDFNNEAAEKIAQAQRFLSKNN